MIVESRWSSGGTTAKHLHSRLAYIFIGTAGVELAAAIVVNNLTLLLVVPLFVAATACAFLEGAWALGLVLGFMAVAGTGIQTGISVGSIHLPVSYVLFAYLLIMASVRRAFHHAAEQRAKRRFMLAFLFALPAVALGVLGLFLGNDPTLVRQESMVWIGGACVAGLAAVTLRCSRHVVQLAGVLCACAALAAVKSLLIANSGVLSAQLGWLQVYSTINPQFQVERIIESGGDTILTLGVPVCVGLLRIVTGRRALLVSGVLALTIIGLVLTYTRTLLGAALIGAAVAWIIPVRGGQRHHRNPMWLLTGMAATGLLLTFRYGQSQYSAADAVFRRLTGGPQVGASTLGERVSEARAALSIDPTLTLTVGRGLGSTFVSPTVPEAGFTDWVHMGYAWVVMKGGIPFLALVLILFGWSVLRITQAGRSVPGNSTFAGAAAGLAGAIVALAALGVLVNPFASVASLAEFGMLFVAAASSYEFVQLRQPTPAHHAGAVAAAVFAEAKRGHR